MSPLDGRLLQKRRLALDNAKGRIELTRASSAQAQGSGKGPSAIWCNHTELKEKISKRFIGRKEIYDDGTYERPSDNCFAFFVIE
jgi:hypothetical protein